MSAIKEQRLNMVCHLSVTVYFHCACQRRNLAYIGYEDCTLIGSPLSTVMKVHAFICSSFDISQNAICFPEQDKVSGLPWNLLFESHHSVLLEE